MSPAALALAAALTFSPFEAEEENVRAGNEKLLAGDGQAALGRYDDAERRVGPHPEIDYDRGHAAYRLGKLAEAERHFRRAAENAPAPLASRAFQNAGNALEAKGDREGAIGAYREALRRDPTNEDARYDLEVLLRRKEEPPPSSGTSRDERGPAPKPREGEGDQKGRSPPKPAEAGPHPRPAEAGSAPAPEPQPTHRPGGEAGTLDPRGGERGGEAAERSGPLSRQEAEHLLDALRARERRLPPDARQGKRGRRQDVERDW